MSQGLLSGLGLPSSSLGSTRPRAGCPALPALPTVPSLPSQLSPPSRSPAENARHSSAPGSLHVPFAWNAPTPHGHLSGLVLVSSPAGTLHDHPQLKISLRGIARPPSSSFKSPSNLVCSARHCVTYLLARCMSILPQSGSRRGQAQVPVGSPVPCVELARSRHSVKVCRTPERLSPSPGRSRGAELRGRSGPC